MFCPSCGNQLSDDAKFCPHCGSQLGDPVAPQTPGMQVQGHIRTQPSPEANEAQPQAPQAPLANTPAGGYGSAGGPMMTGAPAQRYPHPYHELGGWLKAIVILQYIGGGLIVLSGVLALLGLTLGMGSFAGYSSGSAGAGLAVGALGAIAGIVILAICVAVAAINFVLASKIKKKDPSFLRFYHIVCIVEIVLGVLGLLGGGTDGSSLRSLVSQVVIMALFTLYFVRSVRVRTYMGTDEYLRLSPITQNMEAPQPADTVPYQGQQ